VDFRGAGCGGAASSKENGTTGGDGVVIIRYVT